MAKSDRSTTSPPRIREWKWLNGTDFESLDVERTVVLVTCSPLEVHGPHLPVVSDNLEAEMLALRTAEKMIEQHPDISFLRLPPIFVAADILPKRGGVAFRPQTIVRVLTDLGRSLAKQGFRRMWVTSFHGGPRHFLAIEKACHTLYRRHGLQAVSLFSLLTKRLTDGTSDTSGIFDGIEGLSEHSLEGDTHAGVVETSLHLHLVGDRVHPGFANLPRRTAAEWRKSKGKKPFSENLGDIKLLDRIRWFATIMRYFYDETYMGDPAAAKAEFGAQMLERLTDHAAEALGEVWRGELEPQDCHSPLWPLRYLLLSDSLRRVLERLFGLKNPLM